MPQISRELLEGMSVEELKALRARATSQGGGFLRNIVSPMAKTAAHLAVEGKLPSEDTSDTLAEKMALEKYKQDIAPKQKWEPTTQEEAIEFEKAKGEAKPVTTTQLKFELEQRDKQKAQEEQTQLAQESMQDTLDTLAEVKNGINYFGAAGPVPTLNPWDYKRKKWEANINKLLSGKILDVMTKMKQASKTGATGFGQLSNKELGVLKEASTALNKGLAPEDAMEYLTKMEAILTKYSQMPMGGSSSSSDLGGGGGEDISEEDIQFTMQKHGLSREEVLQRLGR